jgi:hypothetical protein
MCKCWTCRIFQEPPLSRSSLSQGSLGSAFRDTSIYLTAIDQLEPLFKEIYGSQTSSHQAKTATPYSRAAFSWLYRVSGGFINRIQEKAPLALAIFAYFAVVLKRLETGWVVEGYPEHIISGVWKFLGPESRGLVWWPMQETGLELPIGHCVYLGAYLVDAEISLGLTL